MTKLTKAQLVARINEVEAELGLANTTITQLQADVDRAYYAQRPSRGRSSQDFTPTVQAPIVYVGGQRCVKVVAWEHGRKVATYKPVH